MGTPRIRYTGSFSPLARRAKVRTPTADQDPSDRFAARQAGLTGSQVDSVLQLKKALHAVRIDIVRHGGASQRDRLAQDGLQCHSQLLQFCVCQAASHAPGPDASPKEALVGVDIAYSLQQFLVQ